MTNSDNRHRQKRSKRDIHAHNDVNTIQIAFCELGDGDHIVKVPLDDARISKYQFVFDGTGQITLSQLIDNLPDDLKDKTKRAMAYQDKEIDDQSMIDYVKH